MQNRAGKFISAQSANRPIVGLIGLLGVLTIALVVVLSSTLFALPAVGDANSAVASDDVSDYYLDSAYEETHVENVVTAVLAAYRGFDTMGEAAVVYSAGVGLLVVLNREVFG